MACLDAQHGPTATRRKQWDQHQKKINSFGFYTLKGKGLISTLPKGNKESLLKMLPLIRQANPEAETIIAIRDNYQAHFVQQLERIIQDCF